MSLNATVGPRASIALKTAGGARVTALAAGTYAITVRDLSAYPMTNLLEKGRQP